MTRESNEAGSVCTHRINTGDRIVSVGENWNWFATAASVKELNVWADHTVSIEVKDNGNGVKPGEIDRVFDPFFSTRSPHGSGGMGLYLSPTLADQMNASIEVESRFGEGSRFRLGLENSDTKGTPQATIDMAANNGTACSHLVSVIQ